MPQRLAVFAVLAALVLLAPAAAEGATFYGRVGPGVDRKTAVAFTGRRRRTVTLKIGTYRYRCDPHRTTMRGGFTVV